MLHVVEIVEFLGLELGKQLAVPVGDEVSRAEQPGSQP
jgi:hypothetical protein